MNKKTKVVSLVFLLSLSVFVSLTWYLKSEKSMSALDQNKKMLFVSMTGMSDLSFYNENTAVRGRSSANMFDIYGVDASLPNNSKASFVYQDSKSINPHAEIRYEK